MSKPVINLALLPGDDVRPCPFCGSGEVALRNTWTASYWVACDDCGAEVHGGDKGVRRFKDPDRNYKAHERAKALALAAWNRRAPRGETTAVGEFLDKFGTFLLVFGASHRSALRGISYIVGPENLRYQLEDFATAYKEMFGHPPEDWPPEWLKQYAAGDKEKPVKLRRTVAYVDKIFKADTPVHLVDLCNAEPDGSVFVARFEDDEGRTRLVSAKAVVLDVDDLAQLRPRTERAVEPDPRIAEACAAWDEFNAMLPKIFPEIPKAKITFPRMEEAMAALCAFARGMP